MPGRSRGSRLAAWTAALAVLGVIAVAGATPAVADAPVIGQLQSGQWIAYQLSSTTLPAVQRNPSPKWGPVTLNRQSSPNLPLSVLASEGTPPGWPMTLSSNGVTLERASQFCDIGSPSCQYYVTADAGQPFFFAASGGGVGVPDLNQYSQGLSLAPPPQLVASFNPPTGGTLPTSGFTFDGSGSHDGLPGNLSYRWTLLPANGQPFTQDGPQSSFSPPPAIFSQNGQYCVTLVVTASDGTTANQGPSCFAVTISNPTPAPPQAPPPQAPAPAPLPSAGATPAAPAAAAAAPLSFAKPLPNFAVPVPGAEQQVTVIWLWKPDWFRATPSGVGKAVRTAGQPKAVKRASVSVVQSAHRSSPSAAPWLAGLGAFGIFGAGWLAFRRRSLRSSLLD
jgi:hypothetical protein